VFPPLSISSWARATTVPCHPGPAAGTACDTPGMSALTARLLVFFTSAAVLVLEILAGRMLAPYLGVRLETFTGIIGTVLAGISIGSWLGGRAADRIRPTLMLGPLLVAGGLLSLLASPIVTALGPEFSSAGPLEIVVLAALGFFAPAAVLSAVTPTVVKIRLHSLDTTGSVVGTLSAVGTAGAIFGTFLTGFLLVATTPSRWVVLGVGGTLVAAGVAFTFLHLRPVHRGTMAMMLVMVVAAGLLTGFTTGPCDVETAYSCVRVEVDPARPTGRILWLDTLRNSYVDLADPTYLEFRYARVMADVIAVAAPAGPLRVLSIGGGGFTLPRFLAATRPGTRNVVLELDPGVVEVAEADLGLVTGDDMVVVTGDARLTLATTEPGAFDLVIGDAFSGPAVPWHLTTEEYLTEVAYRLDEGGVMVLNLIDYPPLGFARAETATFAAVFDTVLVLAPPTYLTGAEGGNFVLVGSDAPLDAGGVRDAVGQRNGAEQVLAGDEVAEFTAGARVLRDDFAPVDQLISRP